MPEKAARYFARRLYYSRPTQFRLDSEGFKKALGDAAAMIAKPAQPPARSAAKEPWESIFKIKGGLVKVYPEHLLSLGCVILK